MLEIAELLGPLGLNNRPSLLYDQFLHKKKIQLPESASELYRLSDRRLSAKLVPTLANRGCHVVSVTDPYSRILGFLDRSRYFFFQVAPQQFLHHVRPNQLYHSLLHSATHVCYCALRHIRLKE
jgi:hypothetical protein